MTQIQSSDYKNVFIIGLDDFNLQLLQGLPMASECRFQPALRSDEIRGVEEFDVDTLVEKAVQRIEQFEGSVDAIATYWDFPGTSMLPILCHRFNLPGPRMQAVLACEHKYWSRLEQHRVIPDHIPRFQAFDPFDDEAFDGLDLIAPFWIKPVKSFKSYLSYRINGPYQFREVMGTVRQEIDYIVDPFRRLVRRHGRRPEFASMKESCIAESTLTGAMCTLEGYVYNGQVTGYGVVDSVREADRSSFSRYEYPSALPLEVQMRMIDVARRAVLEIGLDYSPFNIEFFYDPTADNVYLLEINPRVSQAHTDMFEKVHGLSHLHVMLALALGRRPRPLEFNGPYNVAAQLIMRAYTDGTVRSVPTPESVEQLAEEQPGTKVKLLVEPGQVLSDLKCQDSYSFELANVFIGGRDRLEVLDRYQRCCELLDFQIDHVDAPVR
jgi:hypothetical protein